MASRILTRRLVVRPLTSSSQGRALIAHQQRYASSQPTESEDPYPALTEAEDPGMNGGYVNPPRIKRQFRDPYGNWWDKQERKNFGEPVHEDNDILGIFSTEEYTHYKPGMAFFLIGCFCAAVGGLYTVVKYTYPDRPAVPREFPGGLEKELGGPYAVRARKEGDPLD